MIVLFWSILFLVVSNVMVDLCAMDENHNQIESSAQKFLRKTQDCWSSDLLEEMKKFLLTRISRSCSTQLVIKHYEVYMELDPSEVWKSISHIMEKNFESPYKYRYIFAFMVNQNSEDEVCRILNCCLNDKQYLNLPYVSIETFKKKFCETFTLEKIIELTLAQSKKLAEEILFELYQKK